MPLSEILRASEAGQQDAQFQAYRAFHRLGTVPPANLADGESWFNGSAERSRTEARRWLEKAAASGHLRAQVTLASQLGCSSKDTACFNRALELLAAGVDDKDGEALYQSAELASRSGDQADEVRHMQESSAAKFPPASTVFGIWMVGRKLVPTNTEEGVRLMDLTVATGKAEPAAWNLIGNAYSKYGSLGENRAKAFAWFRRSADVGDAEGLHRVSDLLKEASPEGSDWIPQIQAPNLGSIAAAHELGVAFLERKLTRNNSLEESVSYGIRFICIAGALGNASAYGDAAHQFFEGYDNPVRNLQLGVRLMNFGIAVTGPRLPGPHVTM